MTSNLKKAKENMHTKSRKDKKENIYLKMKRIIQDKCGEINDLKYRIKELEDENKELSEQLGDIKRSL